MLVAITKKQSSQFKTSMIKENVSMHWQHLSYSNLTLVQKKTNCAIYNVYYLYLQWKFVLIILYSMAGLTISFDWMLLLLLLILLLIFYFKII